MFTSSSKPGGSVGAGIVGCAAAGVAAGAAVADALESMLAAEKSSRRSTLYVSTKIWSAGGKTEKKPFPPLTIQIVEIIFVRVWHVLHLVIDVSCGCSRGCSRSNRRRSRGRFSDSGRSYFFFRLCLNWSSYCRLGCLGLLRRSLDWPSLDVLQLCSRIWRHSRCVFLLCLVHWRPVQVARRTVS